MIALCLRTCRALVLVSHHHCGSGDVVLYRDVGLVRSTGAAISGLASQRSLMKNYAVFCNLYMYLPQHTCPIDLARSPTLLSGLQRKSQGSDELLTVVEEFAVLNWEVRL